MKKMHLLFVAIALLALEGVGFALDLMHNQLFFGEMAVIAVGAGAVLLAGSWLVRALLSRQKNYYEALRKSEPLIETKDWTE